MNALITGANGDIGYAITQDLLKQNYTILALDKNTNRLQDHANLTSRQVDFRNNENLLSQLTDIQNPQDVMIYCAGIREITPAVDLSLQDWQNVLNVNLTSAFLLSQHLTKLAIEHQRPLNIIFISSISGLYGEPQRGAYCASKHGLIGLAKSLAIELADHNIRVNSIAPGIIETELTRPYQANPEVMLQLTHNIPLKRWGSVHHIVQSVDFILKNDYLTGSTLVVDGGWTTGKKV